jgi:hypothetical protein
MGKVRASRAHVNLTGQTFGKWTVEGADEASLGRKLRWICRCECGATSRVSGWALRHGESTQCFGCANRTRGSKGSKNGNFSHGLSETPTHLVWLGIRKRCYTPTFEHYRYYGGRGIRMCDRWLGERGFENFLADMGERPPGMEIDRINNDGNYEPGNCRWATRAEQLRNRSDTRWVVFHGERMPLQDVADSTGVKQQTLWNRLARGIDIDTAVAMGSPGRGANLRRGWSPA